MLVLVFKKKQSEDKAKYNFFIQTQKQNKLSKKVTLIMCFNQPKLQL